MATITDRRRAPRIASQVPLHYRLIPIDGSEPLNAVTEDLSRDGARFRSHDGLRARAGMLFELLVPGGQPVHSFGRAAWVQALPNHDGYEVGVRFVDQSTAVRKSIARYIEHQGAASSL